MEMRDLARIIVDYLNETEIRFPDKTAFADEEREMSFRTLKIEAYHIAQAIIDRDYSKQPVAVFLEKSVECIAAFMGVLYSSNFYTPIDTKMPTERIRKIIGTLNPEIVITDKEHYEQAKEFVDEKYLLIYEDALQNEPDKGKINEISQRTIDTDVCYILFTSGSTGMPKGVIISQRSLIDFIDWGTDRFGIDDTYIFGNQTPFYFSMSVFDIYQTIKNGATLHIIPHTAFSFPGILMEYMFKHNINTVNWVPSALSIVSAFNALNSPHLPELKNVFFGGEVMPMKHLNKWIESYPDVRYANLYGPTEVTDTCTSYEVNRHFENNERLPMGEGCKNSDVFLLDENDKLVTDGGIGEVCVRGCGIAYGYYNDFEKTDSVFVQNPLNKYYPEKIYRTGDLAEYNEYGELVYISRKDFQIKHNGQRIELGEIETAASAIDGVRSNCCLYDTKKSKIILFYSGEVEENELLSKLKESLPNYMIPNRCNHLDEMPFNLNGKIDRQKLKERI